MEDKNFSEIFSAKEPCASYEGVLQKRWTTIPLDTKFKTVCGKQLIILSRGTWNLESGPDFLNAKISLNDKIITGDIEIHTKTSDWKAHGHSKDPAFANVIIGSRSFHCPLKMKPERFPSSSRIRQEPAFPILKPCRMNSS